MGCLTTRSAVFQGQSQNQFEVKEKKIGIFQAESCSQYCGGSDGGLC